MAQADDERQDGRFSLVLEGIVLILLGAGAIALPGLAAIAVTILLGWLFCFSGVVGLMMTLGARHLPGFQWSIVSAMVAIIAGIFLIAWPVRDGDAFMNALGAFFAVDGTFSILYALEHRRLMSNRWGFMLASGIFTIALALFIVSGISNSVVLLGTLVGSDLVFAGIAMIAIATGLKGGG